MKKIIIVLFCLLSVTAYCGNRKKADKRHSSNMCYNLYGKSYGKNSEYVKTLNSKSSKKDKEENYENELQRFTGNTGIGNIDLENDYKNFNKNRGSDDEEYLKEQYSPFSIKNYPQLQDVHRLN